jgi:hypothetical protein
MEVGHVGGREPGRILARPESSGASVPQIWKPQTRRLPSAGLVAALRGGKSMRTGRGRAAAWESSGANETVKRAGLK